MLFKKFLILEQLLTNWMLLVVNFEFSIWNY